MSADACAAAICRGAAHRPSVPQALRAGAVFGIIETLTPLIGWAIGLVAAGYVESVDHWIAFGLLGIVGGKMLLESFGEREDDAEPKGGLVTLVMTAIGTSIDAAAVGVSLALLHVNIVAIALAIGMATFVMSTLGMLLGAQLGMRFGAWVERLGGLTLILIGTAILLQHTGWIPGNL
ncbi:manganese efflux pump MntP family protein [Sphingomonas tabacisoli]|uniref:Putative manganese efflux pump MntP n=1 Tax=Sphingomonas tabacisoli TaxID=2249466 RepID=A0ABW4HY25_9SPHN